MEFQKVSPKERENIAEDLVEGKFTETRFDEIDGKQVRITDKGEAALNMGITGPHYTLGAACAAGNNGLIQGAQMLQLGQCDIALAGGVSESIHTFGIFASFKSQGAFA